MATQVRTHRPRKKSFTPQSVLQMFSVAMIASTVFIAIILFVMTVHRETLPAGSELVLLAASPVYAAFGASVCLVLSFLIPEFILDSARQNLKKETSAQQTEDLPFIFVPSIFIRYSLLSIVTLVGFIMTFDGRGVSVFLPLALVGIALMVVYFPTEGRMKGWLKGH